MNSDPGKSGASYPKHFWGVVTQEDDRDRQEETQPEPVAKHRDGVARVAVMATAVTRVAGRGASPVPGPDGRRLGSGGLREVFRSFVLMRAARHRLVHLTPLPVSRGGQLGRREASLHACCQRPDCGQTRHRTARDPESSTCLSIAQTS
jgi:hypothetical protein